MRRFSMVGIVVGVLVLVATAVAALTGDCLEDVDTSNPWGGVEMRQCSGSARQLWGIPTGPGLVQNLATARYLKANHDRVVYTGDVEHYFPRWVVGD